MPKPQHVDDKLYDNILLFFLDGFYRTVVFVPFFVRICSNFMFASRQNHLYLLNQPNEGK